MGQSSSRLLALPQELQDVIFERVVDDTEDTGGIIYCHSAGFAMAKANLLLSNKKCASNFRAALVRRSDNFNIHRALVKFDLDARLDTTAFENIKLRLPPCATALHLIIQVLNTGTLSFVADDDILDLDEVPDIGKPLVEAFKHINVQTVLIELEVVDSMTIKAPTSFSNDLATITYGQLLSELDLSGWKGNQQKSSQFMQGGVVAKNGMARLAWTEPDEFGGLHAKNDILYLHTTPQAFDLRAEAVMDAVRVKERMSAAIKAEHKHIYRSSWWASIEEE